MEYVTAAHLAMVPVTIGLVGAIKLLPWFNNSYSPVASIVIGLGLAALIGGPAAAVVIGGIVIGLMSSGLYSGTASVKSAIKGDIE